MKPAQRLISRVKMKLKWHKIELWVDGLAVTSRVTAHLFKSFQGYDELLISTFCGDRSSNPFAKTERCEILHLLIECVWPCFVVSHAGTYGPPT